jgi:hypothetical protein
MPTALQVARATEVIRRGHVTTWQWWKCLPSYPNKVRLVHADVVHADAVTLGTMRKHIFGSVEEAQEFVASRGGVWIDGD